MLYSIERATKQTIEPMELPTVADINKNRVERFKDKIVTTAADENLDFFSQLIAELQKEKELSTEQIAAAAVFLAQGDTSLILDEKAVQREERAMRESFHDDRSDRRRDRGERGERRQREDKPKPSANATPLKSYPDVEMQRFRLDVGRRNQIKPGNIVGAIANEADLESKYIGEIEIRDDYSTVDLPADMPKEVMSILKKVRVAGRPLEISVYTGNEPTSSREGSEKNDGGGHKRKSYNSKRRDRGEGKPRSDYASKKRNERSRKR